MTPTPSTGGDARAALLERLKKATGDAAPMWCDDFDMDLPKVVPGAREALGDTADVELWTTGHETHGRLNCPTMWNTDLGLAAMFYLSPHRPPAFYHTTAPLIRCTFWEAIRDMWPHAGAMLVEDRLIANTERWYGRFQTIMWDVRGWGEPEPRKATLARLFVRKAITKAADEMRALLSALPADSLGQEETGGTIRLTYPRR